MNIFKKIYMKILQLNNPTKHAEKMGVNFGNNCKFYGKISWGSEPWIISIGNNVYITDGARFLTHDGGTLIFRQYVPDLEITKPIIIGNNVYLGNCVTILPGVIIGDNVVIGAGSVVTKNVPSNSVFAGNPAHYIKSSEEYFEKLKKESLHFGHLSAKSKDDKLREYYNAKK